DAEVGKVTAERAQTDMGVGQKVALAEFHETAEGSKQDGRKVHRLARKGIGHAPPPAPRRPAHAIDETVGARVKDVLGPEPRGEIAFFNRTRGRDYPRAAPASDRQSRETDTARPAMNKNPFAARETGTSN